MDNVSGHFWLLGKGGGPPWPIGGKAEGLLKLIEAGLPVPESAVIGPELARRVAFREPPIDLLKQLRRLAQGGSGLLAVRSSARVEDGQSDSYAGVFNSVLRVSVETPDLQRAFRIVLNSYSAAPRAAYRSGTAVGGSELDEPAADEPLLVQRYVEGELGGVGFSDVVSQNGRTGVLIEFTPDSAEGVVSGAAPLTRCFFEDEGEHILTGQLEVGLRLEDLSRIRTAVESASASIHAPADVEWLIQRPQARGDGGSRLWLLQARPISRPVVFGAASYRSGLSVSAGVYEGPSTVVTEEDIDRFDGGVLVAEITETPFLPAMRRAGAIVTEAGGLLSHAAIVARELRIPCVVGVPNAISRFGNRDCVRVDGDSGSVTLVDGQEEVRISESQTGQYDADSLFCIYDWFRLLIPGTKMDVVCEPSNAGIIVHAPGASRADDASIRAFISRTLGPVALVLFDSQKYIWMEEWERMQTLPHIRQLLDRGITAVRELDTAGLQVFYNLVVEGWAAAARLCDDVGDEKQPIATRLAVGEWCQAVNLLAVAVIPQGYGVRSLAHEACRRGLNPRDFLSASVDIHAGQANGSAPRNILELASMLAVQRNTIYGRMLDLVQGIERYFRMRDSVFDNARGMPGVESPSLLYSQSEDFASSLEELDLAVARAWSKHRL